MTVRAAYRALGHGEWSFRTGGRLLHHWRSWTSRFSNSVWVRAGNAVRDSWILEAILTNCTFSIRGRTLI